MLIVLSLIKIVYLIKKILHSKLKYLLKILRSIFLGNGQNSNNYVFKVYLKNNNTDSDSFIIKNFQSYMRSFAMFKTNSTFVKKIRNIKNFFKRILEKTNNIFGCVVKNIKTYIK
jgi:hypothetical protein